MGRINRLDEHLSNMIAAGEVVERPQGIVKELVENCIDAHASNIEIQISQGGIATITIIDDGDGTDTKGRTNLIRRTLATLYHTGQFIQDRKSTRLNSSH